jgi:hypothetical protein
MTSRMQLKNCKCTGNGAYIQMGTASKIIWNVSPKSVLDQSAAPVPKFMDIIVALPFLTWTLNGIEHLASSARYFGPREIYSITHWTGGRECPRASLDALRKTKYLVAAKNQTQVN